MKALLKYKVHAMRSLRHANCKWLLKERSLKVKRKDGQVINIKTSPFAQPEKNVGAVALFAPAAALLDISMTQCSVPKSIHALSKWPQIGMKVLNR